MGTSPEDEHCRLLEMTSALEREHERLSRAPYDRETHAIHLDLLRQHIDSLHAYIAKLRREGDGPGD